MKKKFILLLLVFGCPLCLHGQDITTSTLRWTSNQTTDLRSPETKAYACTFITRGTATIDWLQRNGQVRTTYTITRTEGSWRDILANGSFTYFLGRDGKTGRIVIERTGESVTITLDFSESGEFNIKRQFRVSEVAAEP